MTYTLITAEQLIAVREWAAFEGMYREPYENPDRYVNIGKAVQRVMNLTGIEELTDDRWNNWSEWLNKPEAMEFYMAHAMIHQMTPEDVRRATGLGAPCPPVTAQQFTAMEELMSISGIQNGLEGQFLGREKAIQWTMALLSIVELTIACQARWELAFDEVDDALMYLTYAAVHQMSPEAVHRR
jgi:hypothetical protein